MQDLPAKTTRDLFTPIEVGPLTLPNRIVMAPRAKISARSAERWPVPCGLRWTAMEQTR